MRHALTLVVVAPLLGIAMIGCVHMQFGRTGPAIPTPIGPPNSICEREQWYELAPARLDTTGSSESSGVNNQATDGLAVYRFYDKEPEDLEELLPAMDEAELARTHHARIEPVKAASRRGLFWNIVSLAGLAGGLVGGEAIRDESTSRVVSISGLVIGVAGLVIAIASYPSPRERVYATARSKMIIPGEDDVEAAKRGIDKFNLYRRLTCRGESPGVPAP